MKYKNVREWLHNCESAEKYNFVEDTQNYVTSKEYNYSELDSWSKFFVYRASLYAKGHNEYLINEDYIKIVEDFKSVSGKYCVADPDSGSELLQQIYIYLWPDIDKQLCMKQKNGKIASDTMTSVQYTLNSIMDIDLDNIGKLKEDSDIGKIYSGGHAFGSTNSSIALAANNETTNFFKKLDEVFPELKNLLDLYHTIGNYCPVPVGFNAARSGPYAMHDFWDLTLMKLYEWNESDFQDEEIILSLLGEKSRETIPNVSKWIKFFGKNCSDKKIRWHNFINNLYFQDYVYTEEDGVQPNEDKYYAPKPFYEGHTWEAAFPQKDEAAVKKMIHAIIDRIEKRGRRIVMRRNQVSIFIQRFSSEAPENAVRQDIHVYADANNIWEALAAANNEATRHILQDQPLPSFGKAESHSEVYEYKENADDVEKRKPELKKAAKMYEDVKTPEYIYEKDTWVVNTEEGKTEFGNAIYVADKWLNTEICYRYEGYDNENVKRLCAKTHRFNDVVEEMLRHPDITDVEQYTEDYSAQELGLLRGIKEKMLFRE